MTDLLAARLQMAISLGFHIIFASIGMAMPFLMAIAEYKWIKTNKDKYLLLAKYWAKGVAIFFAVGAVSGTVLSFELGLLWPGFMVHAGPVIGMPFSLEGAAFFLEAIFLGLFLYGWNKLSKWTHWTTGLLVGIFGVISGFFVMAANSWMNSPSGFDWINGQAMNIDPVAAMFNRGWVNQSVHMIIAAFISTCFGVAGLHAFLLIKYPKKTLHLDAIKIALTMGAIFAILQPISGDRSAKEIAIRQPEKLAALESHFHTSKPADLIIGGIPDQKNKEVHYGINIPNMLSFLAHGSFDAEVIGLDKFPENEIPPVAIVHISFQVMVLLGTIMLITGLLFLYFNWKRPHLLENKKFLQLLFLLTPAGFIALEAGWIVTEVGRQPWIIYRILKVQDSITPMNYLIVPLITFTIIYLILTTVVIWLMSRQIKVLNTKI